MERRDVTIYAPPAHRWFAGINPVLDELTSLPVPSPQEIVQAQDVEIRRLRSELYQLRVTASTIANAAVALTHMLREAQGNHSDEVLIPAELRYRLDGTQIKVRSEPDGSTHVTYCAGGKEPIFDGRPDG